MTRHSITRLSLYTLTTLGHDLALLRLRTSVGIHILAPHEPSGDTDCDHVDYHPRHEDSDIFPDLIAGIEDDGPDYPADIVEWHGGLVAEYPGHELVRESGYRHVRNDQGNHKEGDKALSQDGDCELETETDGAHAQPDSEGPKEEAAGVGVVGAEVGLEGE